METPASRQGKHHACRPEKRIGIGGGRPPLICFFQRPPSPNAITGRASPTRGVVRRRPLSLPPTNAPSHAQLILGVQEERPSEGCRGRRVRDDESTTGAAGDRLNASSRRFPGFNFVTEWPCLGSSVDRSLPCFPRPQGGPALTMTKPLTSDECRRARGLQAAAGMGACGLDSNDLECPGHHGRGKTLTCISLSICMRPCQQGPSLVPVV
jgi:hypothetical protein